MSLLLPVMFALPAHANPCEIEANTAEQAFHLPSELLFAIGRVESGHMGEDGRVGPWPWTVNAVGRGYFLSSKDEAIGLVQSLQAQGVRSIDVGCFQINLLHHPDAFQTLSDAFDPSHNAQAAGLFLTKLHALYANWDQAIAAYHSADPSIGLPYFELVKAAWHSSSIITASGAPTPIQVFVPGQGGGKSVPASYLVVHHPAKATGTHLPVVFVPAMSPL